MNQEKRLLGTRTGIGTVYQASNEIAKVRYRLNRYRNMVSVEQGNGWQPGHEFFDGGELETFGETLPLDTPLELWVEGRHLIKFIANRRPKGNTYEIGVI
jgi:hypothetical protein